MEHVLLVLGDYHKQRILMLIQHILNRIFIHMMMQPMSGDFLAMTTRVDQKETREILHQHRCSPGPRSTCDWLKLSFGVKDYLMLT